MSDFSKFSALVHAQYQTMAKGELFTTGDGDAVYAAYLAAFPEGSNPIFRERTEHDCSCCKNFIRNIGGLVSIIDGKTVSVWDVVAKAEYPYNMVADALSMFVKTRPITGIFRTSESAYGAETSKELLATGAVRTWNHFHGSINTKHKHHSPAALIGEANSTFDLFKRGLEELKPLFAIQTVIELIEANALYRGQEFLASLKAFQKAQKAYYLLPSDTFIWANIGAAHARLRNTVIGTLLQDLSANMPLEQAVKAFEDKMSGTNYKRPTALITPGMVKTAMATLNAMGLEPALERRFAKISDITINNVLWADGSVQSQMKGGIENLLMGEATKLVVIDANKSTEIDIDAFMAEVLPQAKSISLLVKNTHQGNFMSLTAPVHADVEPLFKWDNNFGWSYTGEVADSIKERVKAAGGTIEGDLCCRLAWEYTDDLDFHMKEPNGGHIHFGNRRHESPNGGMLDLDANGADGARSDPAENIFYKKRGKMRDGIYTLLVNNYHRRSSGKGFEVQIEFDGQLHHITHTGVVSQNQTIEVARIQKKGDVFTIISSLPMSSAKKVIWGVTTETLVKVNTIMNSPNHWDGEHTGNKHVFFILDGCKTDQPARGIYNEFLNAKLEPHRKVFEVLGDKTKCQPTDDQLSGLGFSTTKRDSVLVQVTGDKGSKTYNINF